MIGRNDAEGSADLRLIPEYHPSIDEALSVQPGVDIIDDRAKSVWVGPEREPIRMYELPGADPHDADVIVEEPFPGCALQTVSLAQD
jgi:hypothetical protein